MLFGKKRKIANYLKDKGPNLTLFDLTLKQYLSNDLTEKLKSLGLTSIEIHIDWFDDIKAIAIQAKYRNYFLNVQMDENELELGCDRDEPDCDEAIPLIGITDTDFIYANIRRRIDKISNK